MKTKFNKKLYQAQNTNCAKLKCFVPFTGNGIEICRLYEMGQCPPEKERKLKEKK